MKTGKENEPGNSPSHEEVEHNNGTLENTESKEKRDLEMSSTSNTPMINVSTLKRLVSIYRSNILKQTFAGLLDYLCGHQT